MLGGDYVTWGDRQYVGAVGRSARAALGAARRVRASSATTTTITTCRRRSRARRADAEGRAHAADDPERAGRSRRHPLLDQAAGRHRRRSCAARRATIILLAHDPRRLAEAAALNDPAGAVGAHARRPGRAARHRRGRRAEISGRRGHRPPRATRRCSSAGASERCTCRCGSIVRRKSRCSRCSRLEARRIRRGRPSSHSNRPTVKPAWRSQTRWCSSAAGWSAASG